MFHPTEKLKYPSKGPPFLRTRPYSAREVVSASSTQPSKQLQAAFKQAPTSTSNLAQKIRIYSPPKARESRTRPRNIVFDKERLYDDALQLKIQNNDLKAENTRLRTQVTQLEKEITKKALEISEKASDGRSPLPSHLVLTLKQTVKDLKSHVKLREEEIDALKRDIRSTKVAELQVEVKTYEEECRRLMGKIGEKDRENEDFSVHIEAEADKAKQENALLREDVEQLANVLKETQEENITLRDTISAMEKRSKARKNRENPTLTAEIQKLKKLIETVQTEKNRTEAVLTKKDAQIEILTREKANLSSELSLSKATESELRHYIEALNEEKKALSEEKKALNEEKKVLKVKAQSRDDSMNSVNSQQDVSILKNKVSEAQNTISALQSQLNTAQTDFFTVKDRLSTTEMTVNSLQSKLSDAESTILALKNQLSELELTISDQKSHISDLESTNFSLSAAFETAKNEQKAVISDINRIHEAEITRLKLNLEEETAHLRDRLDGESKAVREALATAAEKEQKEVKLTAFLEKKEEEISVLAGKVAKLEENLRKIGKENEDLRAESMNLSLNLDKITLENAVCRENLMKLLKKLLKKMEKKAKGTISLLIPDANGSISANDLFSACKAAGVSLKPPQTSALTLLFDDGTGKVSLSRLETALHPQSSSHSSSDSEKPEKDAIIPVPPSRETPKPVSSMRDARFKQAEDRPPSPLPPKQEEREVEVVKQSEYYREESSGSEEQGGDHQGEEEVVVPEVVTSPKSIENPIPSLDLEPVMVTGQVERERKDSRASSHQVEARHPDIIVDTNRSQSSDVSRPMAPEPPQDDVDAEVQQEGGIPPGSSADLEKELRVAVRHISLRFQINRIPSSELPDQLFGFGSNPDTDITLRFLKRRLSQPPPSVKDPRELQLLALLVLSQPLTEENLKGYWDERRIPAKVVVARLSAVIGTWQIYTETHEAEFDAMISAALTPKAHEFQAACELLDEKRIGIITEEQFNDTLNRLKIEFPKAHRHYLSLLFYSQDQMLDVVPYMSLLNAYVQQEEEVEEEVRQEDGPPDDDPRATLLDQQLRRIASALLSTNQSVRDVLPFDMQGLSRAGDLRIALHTLGLDNMEEEAFIVLLEELQFEDSTEVCVHVKDLEEVLASYGVPVPDYKLASTAHYEQGSSSKSRKSSAQDPNEYPPLRLNYSDESPEKLKSLTLSDSSPFVTSEFLKFSGQRTGSPKKEVVASPQALPEEPPGLPSSSSEKVYEGEQFDSDEDRL